MSTDRLGVPARRVPQHRLPLASRHRELASVRGPVNGVNAVLVGVQCRGWTPAMNGPHLDRSVAVPAGQIGTVMRPRNCVYSLTVDAQRGDVVARLRIPKPDLRVVARSG